jgi:hypothetical protein
VKNWNKFMTFSSYKKIIFHCGLHKTGSSSLQSVLRRNRPVLLSHGVHYPEFRGPRIADTMNGNHSLLGKTYRGLEPFWDFANSRLEMESDCDTLLLSGENFSRPLTLRNILPELLQSAGETELQFVYYLRRYDHLFESSHAEAVKRIRTSAPDPMNWQLNFRRVLVPVINTFGVEAVTLRPYIPTQWTGGDLVSDFLDHVGLGKVIPSITRAPNSDRVNSRLPRSCTFLLEKMPTPEGKRALLRFFTENPDSLPQERSSFFLSPSQRHDLNVRMSEADQGFFDTYGLGNIKTMLEIEKPDSAQGWTPFEPEWETLSGMLIEALSKAASEGR